MFNLIKCDCISIKTYLLFIHVCFCAQYNNYPTFITQTVYLCMQNNVI